MMILRRKLYSALDDKYRENLVGSVKRNEKIRGNVLKGSGAVIGGITGAIGCGLASGHGAGAAIGAVSG